MRQLGEGGKELAVGAGAEAVGAAGAVEAGVSEGAWAEVAAAGAGAGAGAGTGVGVGAEEAAGAGAGVEAEQELVLGPEGALPWACSGVPLGGEGGGGLKVKFTTFIRQHVLLACLLFCPNTIRLN